VFVTASGRETSDGVVRGLAQTAWPERPLRSLLASGAMRKNTIMIMLIAATTLALLAVTQGCSSESEGSSGSESSSGLPGSLIGEWEPTAGGRNVLFAKGSVTYASFCKAPYQVTGISADRQTGTVNIGVGTEERTAKPCGGDVFDVFLDGDRLTVSGDDITEDYDLTLEEFEEGARRTLLRVSK
jgi:hypothetical protein